MAKIDLPGQLDLPKLERHTDTMAQLKARQPLKPNCEQKPLDIGLFSDESLETDLIEILTTNTKEA